MRQYNGFSPYWTRRQLLQFGVAGIVLPFAVSQIWRSAKGGSACAIAGFSDGASYALSVGITNGDLFSHIIAFSPGFMTPADQIGSPQLFISHGKRDSVLPIDHCSRRIVPQLQQAGYEVLYQEFDGPHTVPRAIAQKALNWFTAV